MRTVHCIDEVRTQVAQWRRAGERVALVPTMGNLHDGHLDLVRRAQTLAERVVVSIFVNPTQFGQGEDFERYPRSLPQDEARLATVAADLAFSPDVAQMYPDGPAAATRIRVHGIAGVLEGAFRPGHFEGVATVVNMLLNIVQPEVAVFGEKDYQQLLVVRRMVRDLRLPVEIVGHPTRREPDGLALSSRNQYLSQDERRRAPALQRALAEVGERLRQGRRDFETLADQAKASLVRAGFKPQYLAIMAPDLGPARAEDRDFVVLGAAFLGSTRLIDNIRVEA